MGRRGCRAIGTTVWGTGSMGRFSRLSVVSAIFLCLGARTVLSAEVYQWVDAQGVAHFSEVPPSEGEARHVKRMDVADSPPVEHTTPDYKQWLGVANGLEKGRLERERARAEEQSDRGHQAAQTRDQGQNQQYNGTYDYTPSWGYARPCPYGGWNCGEWGHRPSHRPYPDRRTGTRPGGWGPGLPSTGDPTVNRYLYDEYYGSRHMRGDGRPSRRPHPRIEAPHTIRTR